MSKIHIYTLTDPRDGVVRYVGQTKDPKAREKNHRYKFVNDRIERWRAEVTEDGFKPVFTVVRTVDEIEADEECVCSCHDNNPDDDCDDDDRCPECNEYWGHCECEHDLEPVP